MRKRSKLKEKILASAYVEVDLKSVFSATESSADESLAPFFFAEPMRVKYDAVLLERFGIAFQNSVL